MQHTRVKWNETNCYSDDHYVIELVTLRLASTEVRLYQVRHRFPSDTLDPLEMNMFR